ncbi:hypothetical protein AAFF_G00297340 [Aldrovandia affinis]|uniref:Uncharacterized protein n=1 Tax=Aldrovandia affinis TaxID=143900 RepID=A0AAD7SR94_9TELE|nr:hypothetical protein AAFF_G00297340 [Aldrovandia affinis]
MNHLSCPFIFIIIITIIVANSVQNIYSDVFLSSRDNRYSVTAVIVVIYGCCSVAEITHFQTQQGGQRKASNIEAVVKEGWTTITLHNVVLLRMTNNGQLRLL